MNFTRGILAAVCAAGVLGCLAAAAIEKAPAQFQQDGVFTGGQAQPGIALTGIRFGSHDDYIRMVLDFNTSVGGRVEIHPQYQVAYRECPYRLVISMPGTKFDSEAQITSKPALPFSVVTSPSGGIKEMQIFLTGPSEFKVIEIDDPAKLSIDVRPVREDIPQVYSVQLMGPGTAAEAYALIDQSKFPAGFTPYALVLGDVVVVEQAYTDAAEAAQMDAALRNMGYSSVINERRGDELPLR
jgi:hypothetical protein